MNWLNKTKIAILEKDLKKLEELAQAIPLFQDIEEAKTASMLLVEMKNVFTEEQERIRKAMNELKKTRKMLTENISNNAKINLIF